MRISDMLDVATKCKRYAMHPGESSDYRRGVRDVISELAWAMGESHIAVATKLDEIAQSVR